MGITLLYGRAGAGKTCACLATVRKQAGSQPLGSPLILLTPEQATFQAERELAGGGGFMAAHVLGFRRLAQVVLNETGGAARPPVSDLARRMIVRKILAEHGSQLGLLKQAARQRTFSRTVLTLLDECKAYGIKPQDLADISAGQADGRLLVKPALAAKLADLALLYGEYEAYIAGRYTDPADYLSLMAERIGRSSLIHGAKIWVDGFDWFTGEEYRVLTALAGTAAELTVTLCIDEPANPDHRREESLYHRQWQTYETLKQIAGQNGWGWREVPVESPGRYRTALLGHIERNWTAYQPEAWPAADENLVIAETANCRVEVEAIARDIIRLCREKNYRWQDIAVLVAEPAAYLEILEEIFADHDIPCFSDRPRPAGYHPLAEFLRSVMDAVLEQFDYEPVFRALKTGFIALPDEEIDLLENYVLEFGIRGKYWTDAKPWDFIRRYSIEEDEEANGKQQEYLDRIQAIRHIAAGPLVDFARSLERQGTALDYTRRLYELAMQLAIPDTLVRWSAAAEQAGQLAQADEHRQVWNSVVELFDEIIASCGEDLISLREYRDILNEGLDGLTLGLIPAGLDHVMVTPLERTRLVRARAVYLPGVNDGVLPPRVREDGLLTAAERDELASLQWKLPLSGAASAFAANYLIYTAMTRASEYLWVSYPLADAEGAGLQPSVAIRRLKELAPYCTVKSFGLEPAAGNERDYLAHPRQSASLLTVALRNSLTRGDVAPMWWDVYRFCLDQPQWKAYLARCLSSLFHVNQAQPLSAFSAGRLYTREHSLRGSVTAFETYRACPFQHFARYGLNLKERPVFRLEAPGIGMLLHAVMRRFGELVRVSAPNRQWGDLSDDEVRTLCHACVDELAPRLQHEILFSSAQFRHWEKRLRRTAERVIGRLVEFDRTSRFKPVALEQSFGRGDGSLPALAFDLGGGTTLELAGQIDRLDCAEHEGRKYLLVIDYKSGYASLRLPEVYHGLRLQLLTYLLAARQSAGRLVGGDALPAGVLYYYLMNPKLSKDKYILPEKLINELNGQLKMPGWILADPQVIRALDQEIQLWSKFMKVGLTKNDEILKAALTNVKTAEQFELLLDHVGGQCVQTARQVLAGNIEIRPYQLEKRTACRYCRYRAVCQFDRLLPENQFQQLGSLDDDTIMKILTERRKN